MGLPLRLLAVICAAAAFAPQRAMLRRPALGASGPDDGNSPEGEEKQKARITMDGLRDLVALGLGAPNLGTFKGVDKDTGALKFELDENRFVTKDGKEYGSFDNSKGTYFESGEVDEDADVMGKLMNFFGGGKKKE
mmetsp:Transcript_4991/g.14789  ORF Transcript_4991/g.14789 Transcript_4991/m.14789 type:complete len:136 (+) Transcript_4991:157-564(+)